MLRYLSLPAILLATALLSNPAAAGDYTLGDLTVHKPWARASIGQAQAGAAYLTVMNKGSLPDRLIAAEGTVANRIELHTHMMDGGVMKMRPVQAIEVAPGEPAVLKPGGLHVMLMGLKAPLVKGESFPLTLVFEKAGRIEIEVPIGEGTAMEHQMDHGKTHKKGS
ncbi:MAG: copper chaperone PCu(A)C [Kiloniellales bacterium]|nr:copper chaperone PCu(A)C [Kiloniellales bacterium]